MKTQQMPAKAMDIKQSTNDGQAEILKQMLSVAGIGDPDNIKDHLALGQTSDDAKRTLGNQVILVHGNLSIFKCLLSCQRY